MENNVSSHLWCIIMAGGLGSRFWPVSGVDCPKQFIDVIGVGRSMLQLTFERFARICPRDHIVIVTGEQYVERVHAQVPGLEPWQVLGEPLRRNTAPCIAYAASVIAQRDSEAILIVSPSDHAVFRRESFARNIRQAVGTVLQYPWIITFGALPVRPDTSYGYIQFKEPKNIVPSLPLTPSHSLSLPSNLYEVVTFTEKPPVEMARQFIASGEFFWNTGILVWTLPVLRQAYENYLPAIADAFFNKPHLPLEDLYSQCEPVSVDHGIMEKAGNVHVLEASFGWSDVETWDSLYGVFRHDANGNAIVNGDVLTYDTRNCVVTVPASKTVVLEGLDGYIVAATDDTLMVCRRQSEEMVFRFASDIELKKLIDNK